MVDLIRQLDWISKGKYICINTNMYTHIEIRIFWNCTEKSLASLTRPSRLKNMWMAYRINNDKIMQMDDLVLKIEATAKVIEYVYCVR